MGTLNGGGTIDAKNNLDFKMVAVLTKASAPGASALPGRAGTLGKLTALSGGCKGGTTVPFMIQGTTAEPKFVPDVKGLAAGMLKSQLGCATGGSVPGVASKPSIPSSLGGLTGLFGKKKQ
jgi:hypothetical protein